MNSSAKRWLLVALLAILGFGSLLARASQPATAAAPDPSIAVLSRKIEAILHKTHTPGAGIAIVRRDGPEWIAAFGLADVAAHKSVTPDTLFRIGSTSKMFVSLSLLKLEAEGKLSLQDTLKSRAPDLPCENPWERTDPVRLFHLLEHTSGWDDLGFRDYAFSPDHEVPLREALDLRPGSRHSRWRPGTRFSYSNAGPAVAAYVVQRVTGQRFEDYVEQNFFRPLGMNTASYFGTPDVLNRLTKLYRGDGKTTVPYWKISVRPSGAINASAREMANLVQFFLNRGAVGGQPLLPASATDRMEKPTSTYAAREGLAVGYGLSNYATPDGEWIFHGHDGAVFGGITELAYLPAAGAGYVVMINSGRLDALTQISSLIRSRITRGLKPAEFPPIARVPPAIARDYAGWYELASPRSEPTHFLARLIALAEVNVNETGLILHSLNQPPVSLVAVSDRLFRLRGDAAPTLALIADRTDGTFVQSTAPVGGLTWLRIPGWVVALELEIVAFAALAMSTTVAFAFVWIPRKIFGRLSNAGHLSVRTLPLLATLSFAVLAALYPFQVGPATLARFGHATPWSVALCALTLVFPVLAAAGLLRALQFRNAAINRAAWWHAFLTSALLCIVAGYLGCWGMIGYRSWV